MRMSLSHFLTLSLFHTHKYLHMYIHSTTLGVVLFLTYNENIINFLLGFERLLTIRNLTFLVVVEENKLDIFEDWKLHPDTPTTTNSHYKRLQ